jgi:TDG/mug DNA glycosylase family protein
VGFTKQELDAFRGATVPDLTSADTKLLFVGINPGLWTAATQTHFCHPSNRFYPALRLAGLIDWTVDTSTGMTDEQRGSFTSAGMGISNLVARATVRASELSAAELRDGGEALVARVEKIRPRVVTVAGITAFRTAFGARDAVLGEQSEPMARASVWAIPNPSGLNAHETVDSLADWFKTVADAAGLR